MSTNPSEPSHRIESGLPPDEIIFGRSAAMSGFRMKAAKVADTNVPIVIQGAGGTGKEVMARWIHTHSKYRDGIFVKVNCAAIPGSLMESELFGYEKGAFTGALSTNPGRVEVAHRGTLFLDEISNLELNLQAKLLHFLQDGSFCRLGDTEERKVDTRLICATNRDLEQQMDAGTFRADLYYRINVVQLRLPRLSERLEDIPLIAEYLRRQYNQQLSKTSDPFCDDALVRLRMLNWQRNLRELSNEVARYVLIGPDGLTRPGFSTGDRRSKPLTSERSLSLKKIAKNAVRELEHKMILQVLTANHWNRRKTAQALRISYRALIYKIRDAGLTQREPKVCPSSYEKGCSE